MRNSIESKLLREESGFTLVEVLVTMMMMLMVLFALYNIFDMSIRVFSFGNDKIEATENARLGLEKIERELRQAYPVNRIEGRGHVFFLAGAPNTPALPPAVAGLGANQRRSITFGNDLPQPPSTPPNRRIADSAGTVDPREEITYRLNTSCPVSGTEGVCTLIRVNSDGPRSVVGNVVPGGLTFTLLRGNLTPATATDGTDVGVVRVRLAVNVDGRTQTLTTDVDLRNRG
jgi:prepilin-type N-terminal cleavage/methylation domain-containing protein